MPDEEEFAGPIAAQMAGQMAMRGYCSTVAGEWGVSSLIRTTPACGDQSKSTAS